MMRVVLPERPSPLSRPGHASDAPPRTISVLGIPVAVSSIGIAIGTIERWIETKRSHYICEADVHSIMHAHDHPQHRMALCAADMVLPDGMPLVWISRLRGEKGAERVCGPDLMMRVLEYSARKGWRHYFFGGSPEVAAKLAGKFRSLYPGLQIVGTDSSHLALRRDTEAAIAKINIASPDIVWVALGCPKQEIWMCENANRLNGATSIGVGAAFDFHVGRVKRAPAWMQARGLEWLHRLVSEPRRLWRRYIVLAPRFVALSLGETFRLRLTRSRQRTA